MADQIIEFIAANDLTIDSVKLFPVGVDTETADQPATQQTNREGVYQTDPYLDIPAGIYEVIAAVGALTVAMWKVELTLTTDTFYATQYPFIAPDQNISGGGTIGGSLVYPVTGRATLEVYQDEIRAFTIFPVDVDGVPIDTTTIELEVIIEESDTGLNLEVILDVAITKTPTSYTFVPSSATNAIVGNHLIWSTRSAGTAQFVLDSGQYVIQRAAVL